ncbi:MAG: hypothetical protein ACRC6D_05710, partial [Aeromonas sp.]
EQEKGHPVTLASWGRVGPLDLVWRAYELIGQGYEVQLLGAVEPKQAAMLAGRVVSPWLVLLGTGLSKQALTIPWPHGTYVFGELGALYDAKWLAVQQWQPTLADWLALQLTTAPISHAATQSTEQSIRQSTKQSIRQSTARSTRSPTAPPTIPPTNQPTSAPTVQPAIPPTAPLRRPPTVPPATPLTTESELTQRLIDERRSS